MDPFKITCVTCRAVLTVRKESMIGQIIACPRCNMMVQIAAPAGYTPTATTSAEPAAPTAPPVATPTVASKRAPSAPVSKPKAAASAAAASLFDSKDVFADTAAPVASTTRATAPPVAAAPHAAATFDDAAEAYTDAPSAAPKVVAKGSTDPVAAEADAFPTSSPTTLNPAASRWAALKFPAMVAGGALAGAALVGAALLFFAGDEAAPPAIAAASSAQSPTASVSPDVAPPAVVENPPPTVLPETPAAETNAAATASPAVGPTADDPFAAAPAATEIFGDEVPPAADEAASDQTAEKEHDAPADDAEPVVDKPDAVEAPVANAPPKLRIDPLDIDPEGLNLATIYNGPPKDPIALSDLPPEEAAPVSVPNPTAEGDGAFPAADAPPVGPVRRDQQPGLAAPANVATLLARRVPALKVESLPLCRLLDDAVQWGGVPISVSPDQLRMAAVAAGQPATTAVADATIEEFLAAALKPLRLKPVVVDEQIVLIRIADDQVRSVNYAVDDLAREPARVEELAANIQKLIAPTSWQAAGGAGTLAIEGGKLKVNQRESVQYEILLLLERSRAALALPSRSKYPAALIAADAPAVALAARLGGPTTFTFSQYTPLREIFRHWQEELEVAVLVDWPALADLRLWPNTKVACSSKGTPWHAALDSVLEPLGLAWRPIDGRTIEITTLEKASAAPLVEVYRLNPDALAAIDNLVGELDQVAADAGPHANSAEMATILDAEHSLLLVRQPALVQRTFADWLAHQGLLAVPK